MNRFFKIGLYISFGINTVYLFYLSYSIQILNFQFILLHISYYLIYTLLCILIWMILNYFYSYWKIIPNWDKWIVYIMYKHTWYGMIQIILQMMLIYSLLNTLYSIQWII